VEYPVEKHFYFVIPSEAMIDKIVGLSLGAPSLRILQGWGFSNDPSLRSRRR
jgi:hypothetical protein